MTKDPNQTDLQQTLNSSIFILRSKDLSLLFLIETGFYLLIW